MQEDIKSVEFILENCEMITIDGKYIGNFYLGDVSYSINRIACNSIEELYWTNNFYISINRKADKKENIKYTLGEINKNRNIFNRLTSYPDITSITVNFSNGKSKSFYVDWNEDDEQNNSYQKTYVNDFGDLFMVINKNKNIEDIWDLNEINDKESIDFQWDMYE